MVAKVLKIVPGSDWAKEKLETTTLGPCTSCTSWLVWNCPIGLIEKKKRHKRARSNIYVTSHICSCNCFPVSCFQWSRKPDWTSIQQWITIPLLEISKFSWGKPWCTADPQHAAVRTTEKSSAWLWQSVYRSIGRKGKCRKSSLWTSHMRM